MHRSRLSSIVIDCVDSQYDVGKQFWSAALGRKTTDRNDRFSSLQGRVGKDGGVFVGFQRVPSEELAIHLDIETDDVQAEVARLERLGAEIKWRIRQHVVMMAPSGHAFCVIPAKRSDFIEHAVEWR
jgi:hypothetical protein